MQGDSFLGNEPVAKNPTMVAFNLPYIVERDPLLAAEIIRVYEASVSLKDKEALPSDNPTYKLVVPIFANFAKTKAT